MIHIKRKLESLKGFRKFLMGFFAIFLSLLLLITNSFSVEISDLLIKLLLIGVGGNIVDKLGPSIDYGDEYNSIYEQLSLIFVILIMVLSTIFGMLNILNSQTCNYIWQVTLAVVGSGSLSKITKHIKK